MLSTYIYVDRKASESELVSAFAGAFALGGDQVAVIGEEDYEALGDAWSHSRTQVVLRYSVIPGDFPLSLLLHTRDDRPNDFLSVVRFAARQLNASILTDEIEAQYDDDWLLVAPSGATAIVRENVDDLDGDDSAIALIPESRAIYDSLVHHPLAATQ